MVTLLDAGQSLGQNLRPEFGSSTGAGDFTRQLDRGVFAFVIHVSDSSRALQAAQRPIFSAQFAACCARSVVGVFIKSLRYQSHCGIIFKDPR